MVSAICQHILLLNHAINGYGYVVNHLSQIVTLPVANLVKFGIYYQPRSASTSECANLNDGIYYYQIRSGEFLMTKKMIVAKK